MWGEPPKNRRLTPKEREEELLDSKIWDHYPRDYIFDMPFYKNMIITPLVPKLKHPKPHLPPTVNFDLNFTE